MAGWSSSSQKAHWMFTPDQLQEMRQKANERGAAQVMQQHKASEQQNKLEGAVTTNGEENTGGGKKKKSKEGDVPETLSMQEEGELCSFYEWKIVEVCKAFHFAPKIQSTAMQYFKRFFLKHSVMEFDPKSIMLTVVFVACKVDEAYVSAEALGRGINQNPQLVLDNEFAVAQALDFDLITHGPHKPLFGFLTDWKQSAPEIFERRQTWGLSRLDEINSTALARIPAILATDAPLLFTPAQLSLAAITLALSPGSPAAELLPHFKAYLTSAVKRAAASEHSQRETTLEAAVQQVVEMAQKEGVQPEETRVKKIDRKLRQCRDPSAKKKEPKKKETKQAKRASHDPGAAGIQTDRSRVAAGSSGYQNQENESLDEHERDAAKRRRSAGVVMH